jgi:ABC-2 type transport system ATP-binding protein
MIHTQKLTRKFGNLVAVDAIDLDVDQGEVFGFLGPNGAGKTTTIRMLAALIAPTSGKAQVAGLSLTEQNQAIRKNVGVLTETPGLYKRLSVSDNLLLFAKLYKLPSPQKQAQHYLKLFDLWDRRNSLAGTLSKGMRQKLAIARALLHEPKILFLDEPTASLDPGAARVVRDVIETLSTKQRTIFLCTHNLDEAERLCDRIALFKTSLMTIGRPRELKERLYGRKTVVQLTEIPPNIEESLNMPFIKQIERTTDSLVISLTDPETQNPVLVRRLVELGAGVRYVKALKISLEDLYMDMMEGNDVKN